MNETGLLLTADEMLTLSEMISNRPISYFDKSFTKLDNATLAQKNFIAPGSKIIMDTTVHRMLSAMKNPLAKMFYRNHIQDFEIACYLGTDMIVKAVGFGNGRYGLYLSDISSICREISKNFSDISTIQMQLTLTKDNLEDIIENRQNPDVVATLLAKTALNKNTKEILIDFLSKAEEILQFEFEHSIDTQCVVQIVSGNKALIMMQNKERMKAQAPEVAVPNYIAGMIMSLECIYWV